MFVFNGKHYQDIGWIHGSDIYWVSNTVFDNLTNAQIHDHLVPLLQQPEK